MHQKQSKYHQNVENLIKKLHVTFYFFKSCVWGPEKPNVAIIAIKQLIFKNEKSHVKKMNFGSPPREETGSLQVANTSKYATQSLRSKSLHETQNLALADWFVSWVFRTRYKHCEVSTKIWQSFVKIWLSWLISNFFWP